MLTDGARADSVPNLEIETGEIVGAGHASATGRFDDEQLFYLQARGIPADEARRLVVRGFFADVVDQIGVAELHDRLMAAIEAELAERGAELAGAAASPSLPTACATAPTLPRARSRRRGRARADVDGRSSRWSERRRCSPCVDDLCTHADVSLSEGDVDDGTVECWLHGSRFDLRTGEPTGLPATVPVAVYPVTHRGRRRVRRRSARERSARTRP